MKYFLQRLVKGVTPDIRSARVNAPSKKEIKLSESSARLIKNASFVTNNGNSSFHISSNP
jgi:hypothetical protein